jgi:GGDEF domain-containing protein
VAEFATRLPPIDGTWAVRFGFVASAISSRAPLAPIARAHRSIRITLAVAGVATLGLLATTMLARGVDRVEVIAAALYIGVFLGVVAVDVIGGTVGALVASAVYMVMRFSAIEVLGTGPFARLMVIRMLSYLAFGLIGGLSWRLLRQRLDKLEQFDSIDDTTRLLNARGIAEVIDHELARGRRYDESFVVSTVMLSTSLVSDLNRSRRRRALDELGSTTRSSVRSVDRVGVMTDDRNITLVVLSPQTSMDGSTALVDRVTNALSTSMLAYNVALGRKVEHHQLVFPQDMVEIGQLREQLLARSARDFPNAEILSGRAA